MKTLTPCASQIPHPVRPAGEASFQAEQVDQAGGGYWYGARRDPEANGANIRTVEAAGRAGLNRIVWDLRYDPPHQVAFRTTPPDNPHIWDEPRFKGKETRPVVHWGSKVHR